MESVFQDCVDEFRDDGHTVLLSSHILAEVERLCDRVSIIRAGRCVETGNAGRAAPPDPHVDHRPSWPDRPTGCDGLPGVHDLLVDGHRAQFEVDTAELDARRWTSLQPRGRALADQPAARRSRSCSCATTATRSDPCRRGGARQ